MLKAERQSRIGASYALTNGFEFLFPYVVVESAFQNKKSIFFVIKVKNERKRPTIDAHTGAYTTCHDR